ncbi:TIGR03773 family transporter-associated surface protein [Dactylosporangium sp. NPDC005572]|uniref:TIGR03773 family transporter-associated surface protein n=1 Tax=Dactylosporangium sp. NPDC005572 TaxID=3156889 RepID=UPI0033BF5CC8
MRTTVVRWAAAGAAGLLAGLPSSAAAAPAVGSAWTAGQLAGGDLLHLGQDRRGGLAVQVRDGLQVRANVAGEAAQDVVLRGDGGFAGRVPQRAGFAFLGKAGTSVWTLAPMSGDLPAVDATALPSGTAIEIDLSAVEGPGAFDAYTVAAFTPPAHLLGSGEGEPSTMRLTGGQRIDGMVWAFGRPGTYRLTLTVRTVRDVKRTTTAAYRVEIPATDAVGELPAVVVPTVLAQPSSPPAAAALTTPPASLEKLAAPTTSSNRKVIADGHVDMGPQLSGETWTIRIRDDSSSPPVWRELSDVVLHAVDKAKIKVPAGPDYTFLGTEGADIWLLPQAQQSGILWPGWNTQDPSVVGGIRGAVTWQIDNINGPGAMKLFLTGSFGKPEVLFDTAKSLPQRMSIPANTHAHGNWAFTAPGIYRIGVTMAGTTNAGKAVTDTRTLVVAVGSSVDPNTGFNGGGGGGLPRTGAVLLPIVGSGAALVLAGVILVRLSRRRTASR